jgi:patatin-like phospholipase/acyl hydrolase
VAKKQLDPFLILSLDGGGIRGALQARLLERIEEATPFLHKVDLIAGSSIGGINALCLAAGRKPSDVVNLFKKRSSEIFKQRDWWDTIAGPADEMFRADYDNDGLKKVVGDLLGSKKLGDLNKFVTITSFDLDNLDIESKAKATRVYKRRVWKAKIFHNFDTTGHDRAESALDVALRTSAAPTFFPSHQGYVDGGLVANNPSLCAIGRAVKSGIELDRIVLLSLGTGSCPVYIEGDRLDWGYKQWLPHLLPMFMDGMVGLPDYICDQLLPARYARVHPPLDEDIPLDAIGRLGDLFDIADKADISAAAELIAGLPT